MKYISQGFILLRTNYFLLALMEKTPHTQTHQYTHIQTYTHANTHSHTYTLYSEMNIMHDCIQSGKGDDSDAREEASHSD